MYAFAAVYPARTNLLERPRIRGTLLRIMAGIDENIVREYFEANGFLVCQTNKHQVQSRKKRADENIDFFVENPNPLPGEPAFVLGPPELKKCRRAIVAVRAWHTAVFTENMISTAKGGLFDFLQKPALKKAEEFFGQIGGVMRIAAVADLPKSRAERQKSIAAMKSRGVDGVVTFPQMLRSLADAVEINANYAKSDLAQILRILKNYGMLRGAQMGLFEK